MGDGIYLRLESVFTVDLLLLELFCELLSDDIFIEEAVNALSFVFGASLRVRGAYDLACQIDLRLKAVLGLLRVLAP